MKIHTKRSLKASNGITLIALVITIIVLLILAGISISMLSGDNGILQKATQSKERTEKATVIELAQTEVLGQIAENKGETISDTQLKTILSKYFEEIDEDLPEDLSETTITLTAKEEYGGYENILLSDIYNGNLSKLKVIKKFTIIIPTWPEQEFEYEDGMTWGEYLSSSNHWDRLSESNGLVEENLYHVIIKKNGIDVSIDDEIDDSVVYNYE